MRKSNKKTKTTYVRVSNHIYFDGTSYRVRVCREGVKTSVSLPSKNKAFKVRKTLLAA